MNGKVENEIEGRGDGYDVGETKLPVGRQSYNCPYWPLSKPRTDIAIDFEIQTSVRSQLTQP